MTAIPRHVVHRTGPPRCRRTLRWERVATVLGLSFLVACGGSGGGCSGMGAGLTPIKGGYPVDKRLDSAISLRLSKNLFDFMEKNGAAIAGPLLPADGIPVPPSCGGSTEICCGQTCKVKMEFSALKFTPQPPSTLQVTVRAKLKSEPAFKVKLPVIGTCSMLFDTSRQGKPDMGMVLPMVSTVNAETKLTSIDFNTGAIDIQDLESGDISLSGGLGCATADVFKGLFLGTLKDQLKQQLAGPLGGAFCQKCQTKDDCSSLADQGCDMGKKVCMRKGACMQHLGVEGRIDLASLLSAVPGGPKNAAIDMFAVAGSYASVEASPTAGMSLGLLGGSVTPTKSSCVPARPAPKAAAPLGKTAPYAGNSAPNGMPFHVGAGISTLELNTLGHSFYESGGLCLSVGSAQVSQLSTGLLSALIRSLNDLTRGQDTSIELVVRPQNPPTFTLGKGTFKTDGMGRKTIDDPVLRLQIKDLALDFYVYLDERMVRFMRHTVDVDVPLGLDIDGTGQIVPILGDLSDSFSNVRVTDSSLLKEPTAELEHLLPSLLPGLLGQLSSSIPAIKLPDVIGLKLEPVQFTGTADGSGKLNYLGLFFAIATAPMPLSFDLFTPPAQAALPAAPIETHADLLSLEVPTAAALRSGASVRATLRLDAERATGGSPEWQYRVDGGLWRPFDDKRMLVVDDPSLRLPGSHAIVVRARIAGSPYSLDPTPATVEFVVAPATENNAPTPASSHELSSGCQMSSGHEGGYGGILLFIVGLLSLAGLRQRRPARFTLLGAGIAALVGLGQVGCSQDGTQNQDSDGQYNNNKNSDGMMDKLEKPRPELDPADEVGRYQSAVLRDGKIYVSAYDSTTGDLAFTTVGFDEAATAKLVWLPVDGLPSGEPSNKSKDAYRGGYEELGDDVGHFTALAMTSKGLPVITYQDVTHGAVKLAMKQDAASDKWQLETLTAPAEGKLAGSFLSMVLDKNDVPTLAYMVQGVRKDSGKLAAQLVVAAAGSANPTGSEGWQKTVIAEVSTSCAGLCEENEACVYADPLNKDRLATVCKLIDNDCTPGCKAGAGQVCQAGRCVDALSAPPAAEPEGIGLYARLVSADETVYLVYHDAQSGTLNVASSGDWKVTTLDGGSGKIAAGKGIGAAATSGMLHVAYGDADHRLLYRSLKGSMLGPIEVIDDGLRMAGATPEIHRVGGGVHLFVDADEPVVAYQDQTDGSLEVARRAATGWTHGTLAPGGSKSRGYYPQAVSKDGKWLLLDVVYDRSAEALSSTAFSPL